MAGAHFINLEETIEVNEKLQESEEEEQDFNDKEELKRKLQWAETSYRQERELHDHMSEHGLTVHRLINETAAENKYLTGKMKEYQQQMANIRKMWEGEDEEALRQELLSKDESIIKSQLIYMREMVSDIENEEEKVNQRLREKNEDLTVKLDALFKISLRYQEDIQTLGTAEQEYKHKLEEVHGVLCSKDDEIEKKYMTLTEKYNEIKEYFDTIKDLRQKQRELQEELSSRQQEHILAALNYHKESKQLSEQRQPQGSSAMDKDDDKQKDERPLMTESWWRGCAKALWKAVKIAADITLCALLSVGIMISMTPSCSCPNPNCKLWDMVFDLLNTYSELHYTHPPVY